MPREDKPPALKGQGSALSAEVLREAGTKALQNASELVEEARVLLELGHWSRAVFLCCIAGEELGKCFMSLSAVLNRRMGRFNERRYRERFRRHQEKTGLLNFFEEVFVSSSLKVPLEPQYIRDLEKMKLASLYCDFYGAHACAPSELITEQLARNVLRLAQERVEHFAASVRPYFDRALDIDPAEAARFQDEFLRLMDVRDGV